MSNHQTGLKMKYFVLRPGGDDPHGQASRSAIHIYAANIRSTNPKLADDLLEWIKKEVI